MMDRVWPGARRGSSGSPVMDPSSAMARLVRGGVVVNEPLANFVYRFFTVSSNRRSEPNVDKLRLCA